MGYVEVNGSVHTMHLRWILFATSQMNKLHTHSVRLRFRNQKKTYSVNEPLKFIHTKRQRQHCR